MRTGILPAMAVPLSAMFFLLSGSFVFSQDKSLDDTKPLMTFLSHRTGSNLLYKSNADGTGLKPLLGGPVTDVPALSDQYTMVREPHWTRQSPNGKYFASWVYEKGKPYSAYQGDVRAMLWVGNLEGSWTRMVNPDCDEDFAWSPDSRQLAMAVHSSSHYRGALQERKLATEIILTGIDGAGKTSVLEQKNIWRILDWSSDGERLLLMEQKPSEKLTDKSNTLYEFHVTDSIQARKKDAQAYMDPNWLVSGAGKFLKKVKHDLDELEMIGARYSPTDNTIAVTAVDPDNMFAPNLCADDEMGRMRMMRLLCGVFIIDRKTGKSTEIAKFDDGIRGPICWSPDGKDVYFCRYLPQDDDREKFSADKEHGLAIWAVGKDGSNARFVTTGWSPSFPVETKFKQ